MMLKDMEGNNYPIFEFHIARKIRQNYQLDDALFSTKGNIIFADFNAVRVFVHKLNSLRDPRQHVYPGEVNATALIEEIYHYILREYENQINPKVFARAEKHLLKVFGEKKLHEILYDFQDKFPATDIYKGKISISKYLEKNTQNKPNKHITLEELIMVFFSNFNPANKKLKELFDSNYLSEPDAFRLMIDELEDFFETQPGFGPDNQDIFNLFKIPILSAPDDISKQLDYIMQKWAFLLPEKFLTLALKSKDLLKEDLNFEKNTDSGLPPMLPPVYKGLEADTSLFTMGKSGFKYAADALKEYEEPEHFTPDVHWMPSVVLLAKNTYVWLDQLSRQYQREIKRLDQIPDEELDLIRSRNFTGLWLIGVWERSDASRRIKHIMGNIDAVSSAYSLYDYEIAHNLGGEEAFRNLDERARARGLRLASDMVPNHTGIFSKWIIENPDYFIQAPFPPFPGYRFTGENLSQHNEIELRIEDGYFTRTDASVVFQRIDKTNNDTRYIYHGNDGTVMPWNDTAQLDMLRQEVREAVIQKIFEVARRFSIIRFDAAMTLAKKHFARLWYPRPGTGGDIPSRADYAMSQEEFDKLFPVEFWREVVDRMNSELPDTLLLAEAFWFMEGYFVRTLGMHRVYNSAFMHMLKNEENEKYRDLITNTLEFEPEILKRYVNFMSNPDEETAIRQFGTGDKYFGICVLMSTLPGLPMFAHGQIEGYTEKYGMEYQRAYYNEIPDPWLVSKHEREVFPLTRKRYMFSEIDNFNIFDFIDSYGNVNENVFAYTNQFRDEKSLVVFNNKYDQAQGRIHFSAPKLSPTPAGRESLSISLDQALKINQGDRIYYAIREHISGLEYLKTAREIHENGLHFSLNGFEYRVYWNFTEMYDHNGEFDRLYWKLGGQGVADIQEALAELRLQPVHESFEDLFSEDILNFLISLVTNKQRSSSEKLGYTLLKSRFENLIRKIQNDYTFPVITASLAEKFSERVKSLENTFNYIHLKESNFSVVLSRFGISSLDDLLTMGSKSTYRENVLVLLAFFVVDTLFEKNKNHQELLSTLKLHAPLRRVLSKTGKGENAVNRDLALIDILQQYQTHLFDFSALSNLDIESSEFKEKRKAIIKKMSDTTGKILKSQDILNYLGVNKYKSICYFSKENYEELTSWLFSVRILSYFTSPEIDKVMGLETVLTETVKLLIKTKDLSDKTAYDLAKLRKEITI